MINIPVGKKTFTSQQVAIAMLKHHGQRQAGKERVYLVYISASFTEGSRDRKRVGGASD